jgi:DNA repair exonuclease SbcCD ATPase subunit
MAWFIYPEDDARIQAMLKKRATQLKAEINSAIERGITLDMEIQKEYEDVEEIRRKLTTREERYFEASFYTTLYEEDLEKLNELSKKFEQKIA